MVMRRLILPLLLALAWVAPVHAQQFHIYCNVQTQTPCTPTSKPLSTGDQVVAAMGKTEVNVGQLYGMFGNGTHLQTTGTASSADLLGVISLVPAANGGLGTTSVTGIPKLNGTSAATLAAGADVATTWGCSSTESATPRGDGSCVVRSINALDFGADPTGVADSTTAINNALSATIGGQNAGVYLPVGTYKITNTLQMHWGQCLFSDAAAPAQLLITSAFNASATAVIAGPSSGPSLQWVNWMGTCVHDLTISGAQPGGFQATATQATASGSTIHVGGSIAPVVGEYVNDEATSFTLIPAGTTVSTVSGSSGAWTVGMSASVTGAGVGNGDTIDFNNARSQYAALGTCTSTSTNGTGCKYPPFIDTKIMGGHLWNLVLTGAWDGIKVRSWPVWIDNVKAGALDIGLDVDNVTDLMPISRWESHNGFGFNAAGGNSTFAFLDGLTIGWNFGRIDGLVASNILLYRSNFVVTATVGSGDSWDISGMGLDETGQLIVNGNLTDLRIVNFAKNGVAGVSSSGCPIQVNTGTVHLSQVSFLPQLASGNFACIAGGALYVDGGRIDVGNGGQTFFSETSGTLGVTNVWFDKGIQSVATVSQSGGTIRLLNNWDNGNSGPMLSITSDNAGNLVQGNLFSGTITYPTGTWTGHYDSPGTWLSPQTFTPNTGGITFNGTSGNNVLLVNNSNASGNASAVLTNNNSHALFVGVGGSSAGFGDHPVVTSQWSSALQLGANNTMMLGINADKSIQFLNGFTVATLPTCNTAEKGAMTYVTDAAAAPVYNATATGSGSIVLPVFCNGSNWVNH